MALKFKGVDFIEFDTLLNEDEQLACGWPTEAGSTWVGSSVVRTKMPTLIERRLGWAPGG
jgi:hypothetical protein